MLLLFETDGEVSGMVRDIVIRLLRMESNIMKNIQDVKDAVNAIFSELDNQGGQITGLGTEITRLADLVLALKDSGGSVSPADLEELVNTAASIKTAMQSSTEALRGLKDKAAAIS